MVPDRLSLQALNRATLARQFLLTRTDLAVAEVVRHLIGLQAQNPHTWYIGLWSRITGFQPEHAADLLLNRRLARIVLMRSTLHLVTASDAVQLRTLVQPALDRDLSPIIRQPGFDQVNTADLVAAAKVLLEEQPLTASALGSKLQEQWPDHQPSHLAHAVRNLLPLVQIPPRGLWGRNGRSVHVPADTWLLAHVGRPLTLPQLITRYLEAFGPATIRDMQTWSGLNGLRHLVDDLRPGLRTFRTEDNTELFDLPDAVRPDPDTFAPPRFIYEYDNLTLAYADRRRLLTDDYNRYSRRVDRTPALLLIDGFTAGEWTLIGNRQTTTLTVNTYSPLPAQIIDQVTKEGQQLLNAFGGNTQQQMHIA